MKSINTLIFRHFFLQALLPILLIEFSLIITLFLLNSYQSQQNREALEGITDKAFVEIAHQTAMRLNQHFAQTQNSLKQLTETSESFLLMRNQREDRKENFQNYHGFFQYAPPHISKEGFKTFKPPKNTIVYTTNLQHLTHYDYTILNSLLPLQPIAQSIVETEGTLVTNVWINIDKVYAFSYPPINPYTELNPNLNVTKFPFYYNADPEHNPDKKIQFIPLYKESWAIKNGELGTYVKPVYLKQYFLGVAGFTLNVKEIASVINNLELPFEARAMLLDRNNTLIASSSPSAIKADFNAHSFYEMHTMKYDHNSSTMTIDIKRLESVHYLMHTMPIKGTELKLVIYVDKATIFAPIEKVSKQSVKVGLIFIAMIALFYLFFFWFNLNSLRRLSMRITKPLSAIVNFSSKLGRQEKFRLEDSDIEELGSLNTNLNKTHHELLNILIKESDTGLYNRRKLLSDLKETESPTLVALHIKNYRTILSYYGQESATALVLEIAKVIQEDKALSLYRISDNELALLSERSSLAYFTSLLEQLNAIHLSVDNIDLHPFVYAGIAQVNKDGYDLERADLALQRALDNKTSTPMVYQESFDRSAQIAENQLWAGRLKEAIAQERILPYFQPIYSLKRGKIEKFEALVRIEEEGKALSPFYFLESAEKMGRLHEITLIMIRKVYAVAAEYPEQTFSINLSFKDIQDPRIFSYIIKQLKVFNIRAEQIVFELLETEAIEDSQTSIGFFNALKRAGFSIAIDDFGTGHSNFSNLSMMQVDYIKIDGQFIKDITSNPDSRAITKSINKFAHVMGAQSIAEYVKDVPTLEVVKALGIDFAQGFVISKAVPAYELDALLKRYNEGNNKS